MSNLIGGIYRCVDVAKPISDKLIGYVVNRNPQIDEILLNAGIDPETINYANTPLIGASRYGTIRVLVAADTLLSKMTPPPLPGAQYVSGQDPRERFAFRLWEPSGFDAGGKPGTGEGGGGPDVPNTGGGDGPPDIVVPDEPSETDGTGGGGGTEPDGPYGQGDRLQFLGATQPTGTTFNVPTLGRTMHWRGLIHIGSQELVQSIGGSGSVNLNASTTADPGLWVLTFADPRLSLQAQGIAFQSRDFATGAFSGYPSDQWNMLADNPLHLVASTCKSSKTLSPNIDAPCPFFDGYFIFARQLRGIPSPNVWYEDQPYTAVEIIGMYVGTTTSTVTGKSWDRWPITYNYQQVATSEEVPGDMLNLDLRGRNIGEALDEIAARLGCVWIWDRFEMQLSLVSLAYGNGIVGTPPGPTDRTSLTAWHEANRAFRSSGGFNTITNEMPDLCIGTVHQVRHVSCWGDTDGVKSSVYVDFRGCQSPDGVRLPGDERLFQSSVLATSTRPPLYYTLNGACAGGRVGFIGDHVPAFCGYQHSSPNLNPAGWLENIDAVACPTMPWNETIPDNPCAWWKKPWSVSLSTRLSIAIDRYMMAQYIVDGTITLSRIPAAFSNNYPMNRTPSSGFQWDEISFGRSDNSVKYRMWGSNSDTVLFPHLLPADRVKAYGLGSQYRASGFVNLVHVPRRGGIVRTFLAQVGKESSLFEIGTDLDEAIWLYRFNEVYPSIQTFLDGRFVAGDEYGNGKLGARGYCLNLAEFNAPVPLGQSGMGPTVAVDGGLLRYTPSITESKIIRTAINGIVPCYEYIHPCGVTMYFIATTNGVEVTCQSSTAFVPVNPAWEKSGASGIAGTTSVSLSHLISDNMPLGITPIKQTEIGEASIDQSSVLRRLPPNASTRLRWLYCVYRVYENAEKCAFSVRAYYRNMSAEERQRKEEELCYTPRDNELRNCNSMYGGPHGPMPSNVKEAFRRYIEQREVEVEEYLRQTE